MEGRPWGAFTKFTENVPCTVKIITINPHQELSLQYHEHRDEFWYIISGSGISTIGDDIREVKAGDSCTIDKKVIHRAKAHAEPLVFLEIALGNFDENDIVRLKDNYGRIAANQ